MPNKTPSVTLSLYLHLSHCLESFSPSSHLCLCSIHHFPTSIWLLLAQINFIIIISICLSTWICLDCFDHTRISLILTLLSRSTSIEPWDESTLVLLLTAQLGCPPIGQHHPHLTIYRSPHRFSWVNHCPYLKLRHSGSRAKLTAHCAREWRPPIQTRSMPPKSQKPGSWSPCVSHEFSLCKPSWRISKCGHCKWCGSSVNSLGSSSSWSGSSTNWTECEVPSPVV